MLSNFATLIYNLVKLSVYKKKRIVEDLSTFVLFRASYYVQVIGVKFLYYKYKETV